MLAAGSAHAPDLVRSMSRANCRVRRWATQKLLSFSLGGAGPQIAALLAASPPLLAAIGAAVAMADSERRFARDDTVAAALAAERRVAAAGLALQLATANAPVDAGGGGESPLRRGLAT